MTWTDLLLNCARNKRWHGAGALLLPLLLAACAGMAPPSDTAIGPSVRQTFPARLFHDTINMNGRLSVLYQQNGKDEALHGSFTWAQTPQHTIVTLLSPLGQTMATIDITPTASTLLQAGRPPRTAADVDALVVDALGWPLPISGLRNWLQGFATDANGRRFVAAPQDASAVTTGDGWRIRYVDWQETDPSSAQNRPKRIDLARSTAQAGDVAIRLVLDTWQTH